MHPHIRTFAADVSHSLLTEESHQLTSQRTERTTRPQPPPRRRQWMAHHHASPPQRPSPSAAVNAGRTAVADLHVLGVVVLVLVVLRGVTHAMTSFAHSVEDDGMTGGWEHEQVGQPGQNSPSPRLARLHGRNTARCVQ